MANTGTTGTTSTADGAWASPWVSAREKARLPGEWTLQEIADAMDRARTNVYRDIVQLGRVPFRRTGPFIFVKDTDYERYRSFPRKPGRPRKWYTLEEAKQVEEHRHDGQE